MAQKTIKKSIVSLGLYQSEILFMAGFFLGAAIEEKNPEKVKNHLQNIMFLKKNMNIVSRRQFRETEKFLANNTDMYMGLSKEVSDVMEKCLSDLNYLKNDTRH